MNTERLNFNCSNYVIFDIETTGFSRVNDNIIEIGAVKVVNHKIVDTFDTLVYSETPINKHASSVNGLCDDDLKCAPSISDVLHSFCEFIEDFPLVGHNIMSFDMPFINHNLLTHLNIVIDNCLIDTLTVVRSQFPHWDNHKLEHLIKQAKINKQQMHRALDDCYLLYNAIYSELNINLDGFTCLNRSNKTTKSRSSFYYNSDDKISNFICEYTEENIDVSLPNKCFLIKGDCESMEKSKLYDLIKSNGGKKSSLSKNLNYLVLGAKGSRQWNIEKLINDINILKETNDEFYVIHENDLLSALNIEVGV